MARCALLLLLAACRPEVAVTGAEAPAGDAGGEADDTGSKGDDTGEADDTGGEDFSEWDGATLVLLAPASGSFLPLGEPADFEAIVYDAAGEATAWDAIDWSSDVDSAWSMTGAAFTDDTLDAGTHAISAVTTLPNGDRLGWTVGGILVQHEDAGTYSGDLSVDMTIEYDGTPYTFTCIGSATIVVDVYGETATGDGGCTLSIQGYDLDANHTFELELDDGAVGGTAALDFDRFQVDFDATGEVGDGALTATWTDDVYGTVDVAGELDVTRITRDTESGS